MMEDQILDRFVDAAAALLDLPIAPEHRPGVLRYFALAARFAEQLEQVPLRESDEPAVGFVPVGPRRGAA